MTPKTINRLTLIAAVIMFLGASFVLYREFADIRLTDVIGYLGALPKTRLIFALALMVASYLLLTGYDFLALNYARCRLPVSQVLFTSLVAFAFSNTLGFALVSGGSARYRIYSGFGLGPVEIGEVVAFCTLTYALGVITVGGLMLVSVASIPGLPAQAIQFIGALLLAGDIAYLAVIRIRQKPIPLGRYRLRPPTIGQGLAQIALASVDQAAAAAVLYVLLPPNSEIDFAVFLAMYVVAAPLSLLSLVPGGLGVFETALVVMLAHTPRAALLGSLVAYRCIYFLLPFTLAMGGAATYEIRRAVRGLDWRRL